MEVAEIGRKKAHQSVTHLQPGESRRRQFLSAKFIEENEKTVEELQQQMFYIQIETIEKKLDLDYPKLKRSYSTSGYGGKWRYGNSELDHKKMELEKLTFAHGAYRDKKTILSFSSGKSEVNIHNLNYRMLHETRNMCGERRLLNMINPNKHNTSGFSVKELDLQVKLVMIWKLNSDLAMKWRIDNISDRQRIKEKLMELVIERDYLFSNSPIKGSLWNSLPSTMELRNQIKALDENEEKRRKQVSEKKKVIESNKRELMKVKNEMKNFRKRTERIRQRKQKALQNIPRYNVMFEEPSQNLYSFRG